MYVMHYYYVLNSLVGNLQVCYYTISQSVAKSLGSEGSWPSIMDISKLTPSRILSIVFLGRQWAMELSCKYLEHDCDCDSESDSTQ